MSTLAAEARIRGGAAVHGDLALPGCKGISHRALLIAAMAEGRSELTNLATGEDVGRTAEALRALGVTVVESPTGTVVLESPGLDSFTAPAHDLDCGNSGSAMRMLLGILAGRPFQSTLTGDASLSQRPMARVVEPLRAMGAQITGRDDGRYAPLTVMGASLTGNRFELPVASAQVKTALVFAGLQATGETVIIEPIATRDHTERMLQAAGVDVTVDAATRAVRVGAGSRRPLPFVMTVPGDPSSAAFFAVAAAMTPGASITLRNVSTNPSRTGYLAVLEQMGATVEIRDKGTMLGEPYGDVTVTGGALHGVDIGGTQIPNVIDEIPVLAVAAAVADGVTLVRDAGEMRVKESDRIATTVAMLEALGADVVARDDGLEIRGPAALRGGVVESHGDHRIAMAGAIGALVATGETVIKDWSCIAVSSPEFGADLSALGAEFV
jgi:3-phosphoshikimate 1-carboxyvinyltransferase